MKSPTTWSLKTKAALLTTLLFLGAVWAGAWYVVRVFERDTVALVLDQQYALATQTAADVEYKLEERIRALIKLANEVPPEMANDAAAVQAILNARSQLLNMFTGGIIYLRPDGLCVADLPAIAGRRGTFYADREGVQYVLKTGQAHFGRPVMGRVQKKLLLPMTIPVRDHDGEVIGLFNGAIDILSPGFLGIAMDNLNLRLGTFFLVDRETRKIILSSDASRIMSPGALPGVNVLFDRFIEGWEGSGPTMTSRGQRVFYSGRHVPSSHWLVIYSLPQDLVLAPVRSLRNQIYAGAALLSILVAAILWVALRRMLHPLAVAGREMRAMTEGRAQLRPLAVGGSSEIQDLADSFNVLRERVLHQENEERRLVDIIDAARDLVASADAQGRVFYLNEAGCKLLLIAGLPRERSFHLRDLHTPAMARQLVQKALITCATEDFWEGESELLAADGTVIPVWQILVAHRGPDGGIRQYSTIARDYRKRKETQEALLLADKVFAASPVAVMITDRDLAIRRVNRAFEEITGYPVAEIVGAHPRLLKSGRHDEGFYRQMWQSIVATGGWEGEIWDRRKSGEIYPKWLSIQAVCDEGGQVTHYVALFNDISERKADEIRISHLAHHDSLTQLPNRVTLLDRLLQAVADARRNQECLGIIFLDLDRFKNINDSLGHTVGDQLLVAVAERLQGAVRQSDTVARLGGDEFVVMLPGLRGGSEAGQVAAKILRGFAEPVEVEGRSLHITPSLGISLFPSDGEDGETLLKNADTAMYHAKSTGRNNFQFFAEDMHRAARERLEIEQDLRRAIEAGELSMAYQPKFCLRDRRVAGFEALMRWQRADGSYVSPAVFIPVAEEAGLISLLGHFALVNACQAAVGWQQAGEQPVHIAVNLSSRQLREEDLSDQVLAILAQAALPHDYLCLELTETAVMDNPERSIALLAALSEAGVRLAVDDFGTGYSSLAYLKRLPLDELKIDRSFVADIVTDPNDAAIAFGTIALAHSLGLRVVAEGVENEDQLRELEAHGCDLVQGYLLGKPMPLDEATEFLTRSRRERTD